MQEPTRVKLPRIRPSLTLKDEVCNFTLFIHVGFYDTEGERGTPAEIFCSVSKHGSEIAGLLDGVCIMISMALQWGVPWKKIYDKFRYVRFGHTSLQHKSLLDGLVILVDELISERKAMIGETTPADEQLVKEVIEEVVKPLLSEKLVAAVEQLDPPIVNPPTSDHTEKT